jgi:GAF domain-containing protein
VEYRDKIRLTCIPANDAERVRALRQYQILDTAPEAAYDELATLAAGVCHTPIATITLVDEKRQWFKAQVGLNAGETSRAAGFCASAVMSEEVLVIPDARKDERFVNNPFVTAQPYVRFYAGAPLITPEGFVLGTLGVFDTIPRRLHRQQLESLRMLGNQVMRLLELTRTLREEQSLLQCVQFPTSLLMA